MKAIQICLLLLLVACQGQHVKNEKLVAALTDNAGPTRGQIVEVGPSDFRLDYYDVDEKDSHYDYLEAKGYQGGGPSWAGIIYGAIKISDPSILGKIRFDDEAEGLAIWGSDRKTLEKIGRLIYVVKKDNSILDQSILVAKQNGKME